MVKKEVKRKKEKNKKNKEMGRKEVKKKKKILLCKADATNIDVVSKQLLFLLWSNTNACLRRLTIF